MPQCAAHSLSVNVNNGMVTENCNANLLNENHHVFLVLLLLLMWQHCSSVVGIQPKLAVTTTTFFSHLHFSAPFSLTASVAMANCEKRFFGRAKWFKKDDVKIVVRQRQVDVSLKFFF